MISGVKVQRSISLIDC